MINNFFKIWLAGWLAFITLFIGVDRFMDFSKAFLLWELPSSVDWAATRAVILGGLALSFFISLAVHDDY